MNMNTPERIAAYGCDYRKVNADEFWDDLAVCVKAGNGESITDREDCLRNPFINDPFALLWTAFKNLYPDKECSVWYDQHQSDQHDEEYGFTHFPDDGSEPSVFIYVEHNMNIQIETFAHELAHVAVGVKHEHDEVWESAFDAIFKEYNRIGDAMFGRLDREEGDSGDKS